MAIPLSYNLRNLTARKTTTAMTALGIALTVAVLLAVMALVEGLRTAFAATGHPLQLIVLRKGSTAELMSTISRETFQDLKGKAGIARMPDGQPMASLEMITIVSDIQGGGHRSGINLNLRALSPVGFAMREQVRLTAGRMFTPGRREVVVGKAIADRYAAARIGRKLFFGRGEWEVVGIMDGGRSAASSEIFGDWNQVSADFGRPSVLSSVLVRAADPVAMQALVHSLESDPRFNVTVQSEKEYYAAQTSAALPLQFLGTFVACIMAVGSSFAAMNTMYAAVARRAAEIGTLRVLGFSRGGILLSFLIESLLLSLLGGLAGCALVLPLHDTSTHIGSFVTFSEIVFNLRITPQIMLMGTAFALVMGALGGFFPARNAARKEILVALREQ